MKNAPILVVDDHKTTRDILRGILESEGYNVITCEDGPSALKLASEKHFTTIVIDYQMPRMNGGEVVRQLRRQLFNGFIIGISLVNKKQDFLEAGANQFINKEQMANLIPLIEHSR